MIKFIVRCQMLVLDTSDLYTSVSFVPKTSVDGIPSGAIIGGRTADNFPLYIVQMALMGNLDARNNYAEYSTSNGSPGTITDWDYMVIVYSEYCLRKCIWFRLILSREPAMSLFADTCQLHIAPTS